MSPLRRIIAERMTQSLRVSAHLTTVVEVDMTELRKRRAIVNAPTRAGAKRVGYLPFVAQAAVGALIDNPVVNASIADDARTVTYHDFEHLAVAVDTPRGLIVPVIHDASGLSLTEMADAIASLAARARDNTLRPKELRGGTFTITNTGSRGALFDTPIINQPQVAILGFGAVVDRPVVIGDPGGEPRIVVAPMAYLSMSYDHRLVDGADAARYLTDLRNRIESPDTGATASRTDAVTVRIE
nr:2-oxo acid dehydrogenase subunit E2 [Rhodococcus opacus]